MVVRLVSEEELAETYAPESGWETVTQYRKATRLSENQPDLARAEIARRVNRSPSAIRGWLAEGKTPSVVKGIQTARDRGWITIESTSERFRALNQLVAWIFSGGGLSRDTFTPSFSIDDQLALATIDRLLRWVNLSYRVREPDNPDRHLEVFPGKSASVFGRVLYLLGAPRGVKATQEELALPEYLTTVGRDHQRDFLRVVILNRGGDLDTGKTAGTVVSVSQPTTYCQDLRELFEIATSGGATVGSQNRVWASADAVRDLAGEEPLRSALATRIAFGSTTPPTERAFAATFRQDKTPGGYRYLQLYRQAIESDTSPRELGEQLQIPEITIRSWRGDRQPYAYNALATARELGWITPASGSDIALGLTALLAWSFARGTIRETYYPTFRVGASAHQAYFETIADDLGLSYSVARTGAERSTELRPSEYGTTLGRVLYLLGTPLAGENNTDPLPPAYLYHHVPHARQFVRTWCKHYASGDVPMTIRVPPRFGERFPDALEALLTEQLSVPTERVDDREIVVKAAIEE